MNFWGTNNIFADCSVGVFMVNKHINMMEYLMPICIVDQAYTIRTHNTFIKVGIRISLSFLFKIYKYN